MYGKEDGSSSSRRSGVASWNRKPRWSSSFDMASPSSREKSAMVLGGAAGRPGVFSGTFIGGGALSAPASPSPPAAALRGFCVRALAGGPAGASEVAASTRGLAALAALMATASSEALASSPSEGGALSLSPGGLRSPEGDPEGENGVPMGEKGVPAGAAGVPGGENGVPEGAVGVPDGEYGVQIGDTEVLEAALSRGVSESLDAGGLGGLSSGVASVAVALASAQRCLREQPCITPVTHTA